MLNDEDKAVITKIICDVIREILIDSNLKPFTESLANHLKNHDETIEDFLRKNKFIYESVKNPDLRYIG